MLSYRSATLLTAAATLLAVPVAFAQTPSNDIYRLADQITLEDNVAGDALLFGGDITVYGTVGADLAAAGGQIDIGGHVRDDARIVGGTVTITGTIDGDLLVAGGNIRIRRDAVINGTVRIAGGNVVLDGTIVGGAVIRAGSVVLNGAVRGPLDVRAEDLRVAGTLNGDGTLVARQFALGDTASIRGAVRYWSETPVDFSAALDQRGTAEEDATLAPVLRPKQKEELRTAVRGALSVYSLLAGALIIGLLLLMTRTLFPDAGKRFLHFPLRSGLSGLLYLLVTPLLAFFLFLTIIGIPVGVFLLGHYIAILAFAKPLAALVLARALQLHYKAKWGSLVLLVVAVGILAALRLLLLIPILGWLAWLLLLFSSLGALFSVSGEKLRKLL